LDLKRIGGKNNDGGKKNAAVRRTGDGKMNVVVMKIVVLRIKNVSAKRKEEEVKIIVDWKMNVGEKQLATRSARPVRELLRRRDASKMTLEHETDGHTGRRCCLDPPTPILLQEADLLM
jgi:hypothetical protein